MMLTNLIQAIAGCCKTVHSSLIKVMLGILFDEKVSLIRYSIPLLSGEKWIGKSSVQSVEICDKLLVLSKRDCLPCETAITFNFTVANSLPRVPYMTMMDAYIFICYIFFLSSIIANVSQHLLVNNHKQPEISVGLLRKFRWIFPSAFILCQATAMTIFLLR